MTHWEGAFSGGVRFTHFKGVYYEIWGRVGDIWLSPLFIAFFAC